jgi:cytoskeletal protein CcmA (bactofilin family)
MGIKENFTQAVRELTGIGKDKPAEKGTTSVDELKRAVEDDSVTSGIPREITLDSVSSSASASADDFDLDSMNSTVRPLTRTQDIETQPAAETSYMPAEPEPAYTSAVDAFFSRASAPETDVPVSLFGDQSRSDQSRSDQSRGQQPREAVQPMQQTRSPFAQPPFAPQQNAYNQAPVYYQQNNYYQGAPNSAQPPPVQPASPISSHMAAARHNRSNEESELTIISRNTVIDGNIRSFADMSIDGDIKGDVETTKDIDLNGKIIGNITCNNAMMHTSQVQGNVRMKGNISMKRDTLLMGDLMSTYAEVNGKVKGNLDVVGKADLKGDAVVFGDISASTITVEDGAIIQGYVSTTFLNKEESKNLFPDTVIIGDVGA